MTLITLKKQKDRLIPSDEDSVKLFNSLQINQEISFEYKVKRQRSYQYHKLYFAMLKAVLNNQQHYKTIDNLHDVVKLKSGHFTTIVTHKGETLYVPKSISFDKMDSLQFEFFMREAKTVCVELVGDEALDEIMRFL